MINTADIYFPFDEMETHFIKSIWRLQEYHIHERTETILPKGTVEIIFNFSDNITYFNPTLDIKTTLPYCFINGINYKPFNLIKNGQQYFLGIQLNTIGLKVLFDTPVHEFNNTILEGSQVCQSLEALSHQLYYKISFNEQVQIINNWINQRISHSHCLKTLSQIHNLFYAQNLNDITVKKFCNEVYLSDRQVRRLSTEWLGMNTENFLRYNKYLSSLNLLHNEELSLTQIGLEAGYYDQSHFIREFKSFTDLTPKEYQALNSNLPGHIFW
ncbi:MAG: helix-turn-helix transcriptional regulator [Saprospiraceae bacterium]|nr:helix-turn-helix transcriptional regulator [Saprospiraceae bacterium]